jgi:L-asparaginase
VELLGEVQLGRLPDVEVRDVLQGNSFAMTTEDMRAVLEAVHDALADPDVTGVVVTHGTDTMEETAFLVDLFHDDPRPVVFTGAQRAADSPKGDGPLNLRDAILTAADARVRGSGVLIVFDGLVLPARGTRKVETLASAAFAAPDTGPVGRVAEGTVYVLSAAVRSAPLDRTELDLGSVRVDTVALFPGADATAVHAHVAAGATGVVLEGTGLGNANPGVVAAVAALTGGGITIVLSTRVHSGPVLGLYGNGGGDDLLAAGAVSAGFLRPSQARILLLVLLGTGATAAEVRTAFEP